MVTKQQAITDRLTELLPTITALQESYLKHYGKYFQGLATHATLPDGETPATVDTTVKPSDQAHDYADFWRGIRPGEATDENDSPEEEFLYPIEALAGVAELTTRIRFDVSCGPGGWAWTGCIDYEDGEGHYMQAFTKDAISNWQKQEPEELI